MRDLNFTVDKQEITSETFPGVYPGTSGYLKAVFSFSRDWDGMLKVAEFRQDLCDEPFPVPVINNRCVIPAEALHGECWYVNVIGKKGDAVITTNKYRVYQRG